jgi:phosphatidate cytidylyltransferase
VIFVLGGFWLHPVSFFLTGLIILAGTQYEYYNLIRTTGVKPGMVTGMLAGAFVYILSSLIALGIIEVRFISLLLLILPVIMIIGLYSKEERTFDSIAHTIFPVLYTVVPFSIFPFAAFLRPGLPSLLPNTIPDFSPGIVIGFFLITWVNDTGAYLTGVTFGRHRLMERISPKKSWEGFAGGALLAAVAAFFLSDWLGVVSKSHWVAIAVIISVTGTYGDLVESMFKRSVGVKDSGSVLPGHGGFLDRFDSTLLAFPLVFLFIVLFG